MARLSAIVLLTFAACAIQMAFGGATLTNVGKCKYNLALAINATNLVLTSDAGANPTDTSCGVKNMTFAHLFPNGSQSVLDPLAKLYQKSTDKNSSLNLKGDDIGSELKLDGSACVDTPRQNLNSIVHLCQVKVNEQSVYLTAATATADGGNFDTNLTTVNSIDLPLSTGLPDGLLGVVQACGGSQTKITDQNHSVILTYSGAATPGADLIVTHAVIKTKGAPLYKTINMEAQNAAPFAKTVPVEVTNTTNSSANSTPAANTTTKARAGQVCYQLGNLTYRNLVHDPDVACWPFGCDLLLVVKKGSTYGVVQTQGFDVDEIILTKAAIGLIVGLVVGILILCSCICGIIYLCRRKQTGHQQLVETRH